MHQIVQDVRRGVTEVRDVPAPVVVPGHVLVANQCSLISAGTERYVVELARKSLLSKARERPDHVQRLLEKMRQEGVLSALTQARARLDEPMPLGYSTSGVVLECGRGVQEFKPGDRVATAGPHAGVVVVGRNLCARVPEGVSFEEAAYASVSAIALQGVRLAKLGLGDRVLVIGLGLVGQICVALAKAQGCVVFATDIDARKLELARTFGADRTALGAPLDEIRAFSGFYGVDAAVITAATDSNEPIEFAAEACRVKGRIVLVGVAGLQLPRPPFFAKELEFTVSSSLGPGRGDPGYEEKGIDYPIGFARWTARRNMEAVLDVMQAGRLPVNLLTTHRFPIDRAGEAYDLITSRREPHVGILLQYPGEPQPPARRVALRVADPVTGRLGVSMIGAGNFARLVMMPALQRAGDFSWRGLCTAKGLNAEHSGRRRGFEFATTDVSDIWSDPGTNAVFVATRHDLHAELVIGALRAGKHVFVEKPLCLNPDQLEHIEACVAELGDECPILMVGFNRRFAPAVANMRAFFGDVTPCTLTYRFASGYVPHDHWTQDEEVGGGRIIGEACHAIDTCVALTGSLPVRVYAESVHEGTGRRTADDRTFIVLRHANGSVSSITYESDGDRGFPAERIEMFGGGRTVVNDGWAALEFWKSGRRRREGGDKDKGHATGFDAFLRACRHGGQWPISWLEISSVTWASMLAVRSLREGVPFSVDGVYGPPALCSSGRV